MLDPVDQFRVDLIGDDHDPVLAQNLGDSHQVLFFHNRTGGIIGITKNDGFSFVSDQGLDGLRGEAEIILFVGGHRNRHPSRHDGHGAVGDVGGLRDQHFIAGVNQGP